MGPRQLCSPCAHVSRCGPIGSRSRVCMPTPGTTRTAALFRHDPSCGAACSGARGIQARVNGSHAAGRWGWCAQRGLPRRRTGHGAGCEVSFGIGREQAAPCAQAVDFGGDVWGIPATEEVAHEMLERLVEETARLGLEKGLNVVAFSGGVDSSLTAWAVKQAFGESRSLACIARSASLPTHQLLQARKVAAAIGLELQEVATHEGLVPEYVANEGAACYHCKTELYTCLQKVAEAGRVRAGSGGREAAVVVFNGTNADDLKDPTRLGVLAARLHRVASPLAVMPKAVVRSLAWSAGLPNWDWAASPCLRSRLQLGVPATPAALQAVEKAEEALRRALALPPQSNMRVRSMTSGEAVLELDEPRLASLSPQQLSLVAHLLHEAGFHRVSHRPFRSGSLAGLPAETPGAASPVSTRLGDGSSAAAVLD